MYIIPLNELKKGDIILTSENSTTSKLVKISTRSDYSHAILYVGSGSYIHADANGVHSGNLQRLLFDSEENVTLLRVTCSLDALSQACMFARSKIGTKYSIKSAINSKLKVIKNPNENRQFCSRLVAQAFEYAGFKLVKNSSFCTPQEILESKIAQEVHCKLRVATEEEISFANSENPIERQAAITNDILLKVRALTRQDIQTLDQVTEYLIKNPKHDKEISKIYKESGYLKMWEFESTNNAWRYDGRLFIKIKLPTEDLVKKAIHERDNALDRLVLYKHNLRQYFYINETQKLEYSSIHFELYKKLIENTLDNITAAEYVLKNT